MRKKFISIALLVSISLSSLYGCGNMQIFDFSEDDTESTEYNTETEQATEMTNTAPSCKIDSLVSGEYYVKHEDSYMQLYIGETTFGDSTTSNPTSDRIAWFKEDFNQIPTLYKGDSLILYTTDVLDEQFIFERFEDLGYSIGLCGMDFTTSKRLSVSTDVEDGCTYPGGDTDQILSFANEIVIMDTLGGRPLRAEVDENDDLKCEYLSRCGTITGLKKDEKYCAEIYEGTNRSEYYFKADVRILSSMEVTSSNNYTFESGKIINIEIPDFFNDGYYLVNGVGMFRYVTGQEYNEKTNFNIPCVAPPENGDYFFSSLEENKKNNKKNEKSKKNNVAPKNITPDEMEVSDIEDSFEINNPGMITVNVNFELDSSYDSGDGLPDVEAVITTPYNSSYDMKLDEENDCLTLTFEAKETGVYTINYYDLSIRIPHVSVITENETVEESESSEMLDDVTIENQ